MEADADAVDARHLDTRMRGVSAGVDAALSVLDEINEEEQRLERMRQAAWKVRNAHDVNLPSLQYWNYQPCANHDAPKVGCQRCGALFQRHQRVGIAWLYLVQRGLLADTVGLGKAIHAIGLVAMLKEKDELGRALIIQKPAAILQMQDEFSRLAPNIHVEAIVAGNRGRKARIKQYCSSADVVLIGHQVMLRDEELLTKLNFDLIIADDVDPLRNPNQTSFCFKRIVQNTPRVIEMSGTPIQTKLLEMYYLLDPIGGWDIFGSERSFRRRHVIEEDVETWNRYTRRAVTRKVVTGYKHVDEFVQKIQPKVLRRTHKDLDDVDLPIVDPSTEWLDLYPKQRQAYEALRQGVVELQRSGGEVTRLVAENRLLAGQKICAGLASFGMEDVPGETSVKLDWLMDKLTGDLADEKVLVFFGLKVTIEAVHARLDQQNIGYVTFWSDDNNAQRRREYQQRFWNDPSCRVCIGTTAMETSLNLQVSSVLINVDTLLNPARMEQIAGRIRRNGSPHARVSVINLLCRGTQEEGYPDVLRKRQAISDFVWKEQSELFTALEPIELLQLIAP